ncbi:MAG: TraR/DksA C4-type zinc finger protein [Saprospiraceae bacterium]|nr:TraR/DksA C4-type zinc finger protein [Saprospiraceae bacterium]
MSIRKKKLNGLKYALQNLPNEEFGKCAECGQWIEERRIILMPESRFCVSCQQKK